MRFLKNFDEFLKEGIIRKQTPDKSRAKDLIRESERKYKSLNLILNKIGILHLNANDIVEHCYDIIINLLRAKMLIIGFNASGIGAHEAEISYMEKLKFNENEIQFTNQLRYFRNGILYYGKVFDKEYAGRVVEFLNKIYPKLKKLILDF